MKLNKKIAIVLILAISFISISITVIAAPLDTLNVTTSADVVRPGEEVTLNISFGQGLRSLHF